MRQAGREPGGEDAGASEDGDDGGEGGEVHGLDAVEAARDEPGESGREGDADTLLPAWESARCAAPVGSSMMSETAAWLRGSHAAVSR